MKKVILFLIVVFDIIVAHGQDKTIYGDFIINTHVFKYKATRHVDKYSLQLSALAGDNFDANLDSLKLNHTIESLKNFPSQTFNGDTARILQMLPEILLSLKLIEINSGTSENRLKTIDTLITYIKALNKNIKVDEKNYDVLQLVTQYKNYLETRLKPFESREMVMEKLDEQIFIHIFDVQIKQLTDQYQLNRNITHNTENKAREIFVQIKTRFDFLDDEPITAYLILKRKYITLPVNVKIVGKVRRNHPGYYKKLTGYINSKDTSIYRNRTTKKKLDVIISETRNVLFKIESVQAEFEDGNLKNVFIDMVPETDEYLKIFGSNSLRFRNNFPVRVAGKFDPERFVNYNIQCSNSRDLLNNAFPTISKRVESNNMLTDIYSNVHVNLSDILDYKIIAETDNEDYSPANKVYRLTEINSVQELKKEQKSKILNVVAYSDLVGVNDTDPNGLLQLEFSKKINIFTHRIEIIKRGITIMGYHPRGNYVGFLTNFTPNFILSKIENNNRYLPADTFLLNRTASIADSQNHFNINPLNVYRYQRYKVGVDVNIVRLSMQNIATHILLNGSFNFGRTQISDSIKVAYDQVAYGSAIHVTGVNSTIFGGGIAVEFKPDNRYSVSMTYDWRWIIIQHPLFDIDKNFTNRFHSIAFDGYLKINDNSKVFLRYKKNWIYQSPKYNFEQILIGYQLDIFQPAKKPIS